MRILALTALLAVAAAPADLLTIAGKPFPQADILDARVTADGTGSPNIYVTMTPAAAQRLAALSNENVGKPIAIAVGGNVLMSPVVREAITGGAIEISGATSFDAAVVLARRISGKDPLPESLEE
jgi:preprotein translocase subunit SecD